MQARHLANSLETLAPPERYIRERYVIEIITRTEAENDQRLEV
jgi:hypothetical protein